MEELREGESAPPEAPTQVGRHPIYFVLALAALIVSGVSVYFAFTHAEDGASFLTTALLALALAGAVFVLPDITEFKFGSVALKKQVQTAQRDAKEARALAESMAPSQTPKAGPTAAGVRASGQKAPSEVKPARTPLDPDDPERLGDPAEQDGRVLRAALEPIPGTDGWALVRLSVRSTDPKRPLVGLVTFALHPTFTPREPTVPVVDGVALLVVRAWGRFTVGALCDNGKTRLELNLQDVPGGPGVFYTR